MAQRLARVAPLFAILACQHAVPPESDASGGTNTAVNSGGRTGGGGTSNFGGFGNGGASATSLGGSSRGGSTSGGASSIAGAQNLQGGSTNVGGQNGGAQSGGTQNGGAGSGSGGSPAGGMGDPAGTVAPPYTFPQNLRSSYCTYPTLISAKTAQAAYTRWKTELVTSDGAVGFRRVRRPGNEGDTTVSEGIGYGMILSVMMDDHALFDDLWQYSQKFLNQNGLMNWKVDPSGSVPMDGVGAATDADEDMAWALALADKKWGGKGALSTDYLTLAKQQIDKIFNFEVDHGRGQLLVAGDSWGTTVVYNPSYFAPNQYRLFAKISGNSAWNTVIDKGYEMLGKTLTSANGNATNGLVPAWTNDSAVPTPAFPGAPTNYQYDAVRTPFRIGMDYCDFGEPRAKAYLAKVATFFSGIGAANIVDGYELNGTPKAENPSSQSALFVGAAGVAAMSDVTYKSFLNDTYGLLTTKEMLPPSYYFNLSWDVFSQLMMSGNLFDYTAH